jgi:hypothetical protein
MTQTNRKAKPIGDRLITLREVVEILRLSPRTVREYARRGEPMMLFLEIG